MPTECPGYVFAARYSGERLTESTFEDGSPRHKAEPSPVIEQRDSPARQEDRSSEDTGDGHAVQDRPIEEPGLNLYLGSKNFELTCSEGLEKISCESRPLCAALGQAFSNEESHSVTERRAHLGAEAGRWEVVALLHQ